MKEENISYGSLLNQNLLVVSLGYPSKSGDFQIYTFVKSQVDELKKYFNKVYVVCPTPYFPKFIAKLWFIPLYFKEKSLRYDYRYDNVRVFFPRFFSLPIGFFREKNGVLSYSATKKCILKNNIKFYFTHAHFSYPPGYVAYRIKEDFNVDYFLTIQENAEWFMDQVKEKKKEYVAGWKNAKKLIRVNERDLKILKKFNKNSICIPNTYDKQVFKKRDKKKIREELKLPLDKNIILNVGFYIKRKNQETLIKSAEEIIKKRKDVLFLLVGRGPEHNYLQGLIDRSGLNDYVKLMGEMDSEKVAKFMSASDIFSFPSRSEGNPTVMFECLGAGLPFIGTDVGGIAEIINSEKFGFILDNPEDYKGLSILMEKGINKKWDKEEIFNYAKSFNSENVVKKIISCYLGGRG